MIYYIKKGGTHVPRKQMHSNKMLTVAQPAKLRNRILVFKIIYKHHNYLPANFSIQGRCSVHRSMHNSQSNLSFSNQFDLSEDITFQFYNFNAKFFFNQLKALRIFNEFHRPRVIDTNYTSTRYGMLIFTRDTGQTN